MFICMLVSQVASFGGWECVECGQNSITSSKTCEKCDADKFEIAGAVNGLVILCFVYF